MWSPNWQKVPPGEIILNLKHPILQLLQKIYFFYQKYFALQNLGMRKRKLLLSLKSCLVTVVREKLQQGSPQKSLFPARCWCISEAYIYKSKLRWICCGASWRKELMSEQTKSNLKEFEGWRLDLEAYSLMRDISWAFGESAFLCNLISFLIWHKTTETDDFKKLSIHHFGVKPIRCWLATFVPWHLILLIPSKRGSEFVFESYQSQNAILPLFHHSIISWLKTSTMWSCVKKKKTFFTYENMKINPNLMHNIHQYIQMYCRYGGQHWTSMKRLPAPVLPQYRLDKFFVFP